MILLIIDWSASSRQLVNSIQLLLQLKFQEYLEQENILVEEKLALRKADLLLINA